MQQTSTLYRQLMAGDHWVETRLVVGESGRLLTEGGDVITFGGTSILVARSGADSGYAENVLMSVETTHSLFSGNVPAAGCVVAGEIDVEMLNPAGEFPRQAMLVPYIRLTDGTTYSEWLQKGVYTNRSDTITIPPNDAVAFSVGTEIEVFRKEATSTSGSISFVAAPGVTIGSLTGALTLAGNYAVAVLKKIETDEWLLSGALV